MAKIEGKNLGTVDTVDKMQTGDMVFIERGSKPRRVKPDVLLGGVSDSLKETVANAQSAATAATAAATAANKAASDLQTDVSGLLAAQGSYSYISGLRGYGAASAAFSKTYGTREGLLATLSHFKLGTVKNAKIQHLCAPGRITLASNGDTLAIDGSDGDLLICYDTHIHSVRNTGTISSTKYNIISLGLVPHLVGSFASKDFGPFAVTPEYTVNGKIFDDARDQAHSVYNTNLAGTYSADNGCFKQHIKTSGGGYFNQNISSLRSSEQARNKNTDPTKKGAYMGAYYEFMELLWEAMYLELGTYDITDPAKFGYGMTNTGADATNFADTAISGISGIHVIEKGGTEHYYSLWDSSVRNGASGSNVQWLLGLSGNPRVPLEALEQLRVLDNITKNNLLSYIGDSTAVFSDYGATVQTGSTVNLKTGGGMTSGKKYYQVRNVPNCQGLADGVMTAVVNCYVKVDMSDGWYLSDGKTSLNGGTVIFKFSIPVYRGWAPFKGLFTQYEGMHYRHTNTDGTERMEFWSADSYKDVPTITTTTGYCDGNEINGVLKGLKKRFVTDLSSGWVTKAELNYSLFAYSALGAGQHSYECAFIYKDHSWGYGDGTVAQGKSCTNASAVGCAVDIADAGRSLFGFNACSHDADNYAGAFAVAELDVSQA